MLDTRGGKAREPLGRKIPEHDLESGVNEDHTIVHGIEQLLVKRALALPWLRLGDGLSQAPQSVRRFRVQLLQPAPRHGSVELDPIAG